VEGTFAEAVLLETVVLSILNHDCAIASAASRMAHAAGDRPLIEMGSRRTHELAAVAAARAAYICGFAFSSNLLAGHRYGVPTTGTAAHAFILVHDSEEEAFRAQLDSLGVRTTLLVDTYEVDKAVRTAAELAGPALGGVRIDSGDLTEAASEVRQTLDTLGAAQTKIVVTGDLDEFAIAALTSAPVDAYGVGTALVTGSGHPTASLVYKLVAREDPSGAMRPVAKRSVGKPSKGGRKWAYRQLSHGTATAELVHVAPPDTPWEAYKESAPGLPPGGRPLLAALVRDGQIVGEEPLGAARDRHRAALAELPPKARSLSPGDPAVPTIFN
jgi:nicotinate phosphoribosyltransferase